MSEIPLTRGPTDFDGFSRNADMAETIVPPDGRYGVARLRNIMSIDVEDLDAMNFESMAQCRHQKLESRVCANMNVLLESLAAHGAKATMFFLGTVAERFPDLVRRADAEGHEIASHGYGHELVSRQTRDEFREDVARSIGILQQITGRPVLGYRAPSWSISNKTPWAYEVLVELGLRYDASLFPFTTYLYGDGNAPTRPFARQVGQRTLHEVPASVLCLFGRRFPFGGGFYLRAMPWLITRMATYLANRAGQPVVFYIHPREIDPQQPRFSLPWRDRLVAYANLGTTLKKVHRLLSLGPTVTVLQSLEACGMSNHATATD
jgi:polysaccharide deacetylase family protein (PEP-CTERM system associated)